MNTHPNRTFTLDPETRAMSGGVDFAQYARSLMLARGDLLQAAEIADADARTSDRVKTVLKAAVSAGTTTDSDWANSLSQYQITQAGFMASIATSGLFDRVLNEAMVRVPLRARVVMSTVALLGSTVAEGAIKPVSDMTFSASDMAPVKVAAIIVLSDELVRLSPFGTSYISAELRKGVVAASDDAFLSGITTSLTPVTSGGASDADGVAADLGALVGEIALTASSKLFLAVSPRTAAKTALLPGTGFAYGTMGGISVAIVPTDSVPDDEAVLIDGSRIAGNSDAIVLSSTNSANLVLDSAPIEGAAAVTSLWQNNLLGLRAERLFAFQAAEGSVAKMTGITWGTA